MNNGYLVMGIAAILTAIAIVCFYAYKHKAEFDKLVNELEKFLASPTFKESVRKIMKKAEYLIVGNKKGQEKLKYVCGAVNAMLPVYLQPVVTAERLEKFVNLLFEEFAQEKDGHRIVK